MQKEFNKLNIDKKRKFLIKNIAKDDFFNHFHKKINKHYPDYLNKKSLHKELVEKKNIYLFNKICRILTLYKDNIIDLYNNPNSYYFYNNAIKYKNKLEKIIPLITLNYKDENDFTLIDILLDINNETTNLISKEELGLFVNSNLINLDNKNILVKF